MGYSKIILKSLPDIADTVIKSIKSIRDPFTTPILVFHNTKVQQWFKAYYLKNYSEVLMNVKMETLSVFVNDIVNSKHEKTIMDRALLRDYIIKALVCGNSCFRPDNNNPEDPLNYIYDASGKLDGLNLYSFAGRLAELYLSYEFDEIDGWRIGKDNPKLTGKAKREKELYDAALSMAEQDGYWTTKRLFEESKDLSYPKAPVYIIDNSYVTNLCQTILKGADEGDREKNTEIHLLSLEADTPNINPNVRLVSAPSRKREVEAIHSDICKLASADKNLRYNDFIVYAPNIDKYAATIRSVFQQKDTDFPNVPFRIAGESSEKTEMLSMMDMLYDIASKRFFTRNDFYRYIKNSMIQRKWHYNEDASKIWMETIFGSGTHRNSDNGDDWVYLRNRLLLQTFVSNTSDLENRTQLGRIADDGGPYYLPYSSIGLTVDLVSKMLDIIEVLQSWNALFQVDLNDLCLGPLQLREMEECLDGLFSIKNVDDEEINYQYVEVKNEVERLISLDCQIPANTVLLLLKDALNRFTSNPSDLFSNGVVFLNLSCDDIVAANHIYVMGMSSNQFPRVDIKSELNVREEICVSSGKSNGHRDSKELDELSVRDLCANTKNLTFHYLNRNLATDAELKPSSLVKELSGKIGDDIPLDEKRNYSELWTGKEFRGKEYYEQLCLGTAASKSTGGGNNSGKSALTGTKRASDNIFKISDFKNYLDKPFIYRFEKLINTDDDEQEKKSTEEFEIIDEDHLSEYNIVKKLILDMYEVLKCTDSVKESKKERRKQKEKLENILPTGEIGTVYYEHVYNDFVLPLMEELNQGYQPVSLQPVLMVAADGTKWQINPKIDMFKLSNGTDLFYIEPINYYSNPKEKHFFNMYIFSLIDVFVNYNNGTKYTIHLGPVGKGRTSKQKIFSINGTEAENLLKEMYQGMTDYTDMKYMSSHFLKLSEDSMPKTMDKFAAALEYDSAWTYFQDHSILNPYEDLGYTEQTIKDINNSALIQEKNRIIKMIKFPQ